MFNRVKTSKLVFWRS